ncbi:MAG: hypothetical protein ACKVIM_05920 [Flavobacteriales bacterium]|mgnify:FL=1|jgi:hypothetical protein|tara:strand:- start:518 stop:1684 length:1167 start_codon:yes stop_codon:yes gene_type:complete
MKKLVLITALFIANMAISQTIKDTIVSDIQVNSAQRMLNKTDTKLTIGGYGEITYNQPESLNGELDVQRFVLNIGYKFSDKVQFISEIEIEHVEEVFVEQAFINYSVGDNISLRGGLMLVPMGIVNEYHEPTTFNGVERPSVDNKIVPTTWREIGVGVNGRLPDASLSYQAYIFNGFKSTELDGDEVNGLLKGSSGLRGGRQKGIQSTISSPTFSAKLDYYGILGLRLGLSGYFGKTQADDAIQDLDGAIIGVSMVGFDARYKFKKFEARGQFIYASLTDTDLYNDLTGKDLGSGLMGYYVEGGYNVLPIKAKQRLVAFARYEQYDTQASMEGNTQRNDAYNRNDLTAGLSYHIVNGVVLKGDYQFKNNALSGSTVNNQLNFGIGVWF